MRVLKKVDCHFLRMSRGKRSFWKCGFSVFAKCLVENARFGSVDCHCLLDDARAREFSFRFVAVTLGFAF